jgi:hypothetical protein
MSASAYLIRPEPLSDADQLDVTRLSQVEHLARRTRDAIWAGDTTTAWRLRHELREQVRLLCGGAL